MALGLLFLNLILLHPQALILYYFIYHPRSCLYIGRMGVAHI